MQECRLLKFRSIMEAVSWVCDDALDDHVCGDLNSPSLVRKQTFWKPCNTTLQTHAVDYVVVLGTNKSQSEIFERWSDPREIQ